MPPSITLFTIGHSSHSFGHFASLLQSHGITAVADVRSAPFSRRSPQFNRQELKNSLSENGIAYSFLGRELGGRPQESFFYCDGIADYEKMATAPIFQEGIVRILKGARQYRVALLCSEHDPLDCHRCLLVARQFAKQHMAIEHIMGDGTLQSQKDIEKRLLELSGQNRQDLFSSYEDQISAAYRRQNLRVGYSEKTSISKTALVK